MEDKLDLILLLKETEQIKEEQEAIDKEDSEAVTETKEIHQSSLAKMIRMLKKAPSLAIKEKKFNYDIQAYCYLFSYHFKMLTLNLYYDYSY